MEFFAFIIFVLAITYNQGAARPTDNDLGFITKNGLENLEDGNKISNDELTFKIPTTIKNGLSIIIKGTLNTDNKLFTVVLPRTKGDCTIKYDFEKHTMVITPGIEGYDNHKYTIDVTQGEKSTFSLKIQATTNQNEEHIFKIIFNGNGSGPSDQLICDVKNFDDFGYIVMKEGVADVDSLLFEFKDN